MTFTRRKRESKCYNPNEWDKIHFIKYCECTEESWECSEGYARRGDSICKSIDG